MKKSFYSFLFIAFILPFLVQCASQNDVNEIRYQLRIVNKKLEDMKSNQVNKLQKRQAAASGQRDQLENEILAIKSQLEETYYLNQKLREQNKELENSISTIAQTEATKRQENLQRFEQLQKEKEARLNELNEKIRLQQESVQAIQNARIKDAERRAREAALAAELAKTKARAVSTSLRTGRTKKHIHVNKRKIKKSVVGPPVKKNSSSSAKKTATQQTIPAPVNNTSNQPENSMAVAQKYFAKKQFAQALALFERIANNPAAMDAVDARFMMGECLFKQKEYDKAIMQYQKIISQHAKHAKAPAAMLNQGRAFERLADKDTAMVIYKKLLKKHGTSPEAATAKDRLDKL